MFKSLVKSVLSPSGISYRLLSYFHNYSERGYQPRKISTIEKILERFSTANDKVNFVQVGSNDGVSGDPINYFVNNFNWHGVLIEPVPFLFEQLQKNYEHKRSRLQFLNIAVGLNEGSEQTIYVFDEKFRGKVPDWYYQLGTFNRQVIYHHDIPNVDDYIVERKVAVRTLRNVLQTKPGEGNIDLLHIDTEGYDFEILKTMDFAQVKPKIVLVEYIHLKPDERRAMIHLLKENEYRVYLCNQDYIALQSSVHDDYMKGTKVCPFWE